MNPMARKGILIAMMEPPTAIEEEFNDWYDTEHVPERAACPGFESARRFVCLDGWPRYMALYDLAYRGVLDEAGYAAISGTRFSPWSKRILAKVRGQYRFAGEQVYPGHRVTLPRQARLAMLRFKGLHAEVASDLLAHLDAACSAIDDVASARLFHDPDWPDGGDFVALIEAPGASSGLAFPASAFGALGSHLDLVNIYSPHWMRGPLKGVYADGH